MTQILHKIKNTFANALIVFISITVFSLFLEVAIRLTAKGVDLFNSTNFVTDRLNLFESTYPTAYHPNLGYIPRPGTTGANNRWGKSVTILEHGVRSNRDNGKAHDARGAIILAVGDSFTFGDFVSNRNTWPAHLDTLVKESVINGGVFGYGLDQTVLRAEELANFFSVKIALISFIPADINRTQFSVRAGVSKPYFFVDDGQLVRKNQPVPDTRPVKDEIGLLRTNLGHSYLIYWIMRRLGLSDWWLVAGWDTWKVHSEGMQIACLLTKRLRTLGLRAGAQIVMVAQYQKGSIVDGQESSEGRDRGRDLLECAKSNGLEVQDLYQPLLKIYQSDPDLFDSYYIQNDGHMTAAGNRFVAEQIAHYLERH